MVSIFKSLYSGQPTGEPTSIINSTTVLDKLLLNMFGGRKKQNKRNTWFPSLLVLNCTISPTKDAKKKICWKVHSVNA